MKTPLNKITAESLFRNSIDNVEDEALDMVLGILQNESNEGYFKASISEYTYPICNEPTSENGTIITINDVTSDFIKEQLKARGFKVDILLAPSSQNNDIKRKMFVSWTTEH
jgi:hypothetical protein